MTTQPWYLRLLNTHWYFLLLCIFFSTHGLFENVGLIPIGQLLLLLLALFVLSFVCYLIFFRLFRNSYKSSLFTFIFLLVFLFFGAVQDYLEAKFPGKFVSSLTFLTILSIVVLAIAFLFVRKSSGRYGRLPIYLNLVLLIYILVDITGIVTESLRYNHVEKINLNQSLKLSHCDSCGNPSVYLVLLDEYSGSSSLREFYNYNNESFEDSLRSLGFHVVQNPRSNYYYTVYSIASMLNLDYIPAFHGHTSNDDEEYRMAIGMIKDNLTVKHFAEEGYDIRNYSYFDMETHPAAFKNDYLPGKINIVIHKTMYVRVIGQLLKKWGLGTPVVFSSGDWEDQYVENNKEMMEKVLRDKNDTVPFFTYVHLMMPHEPFAFNSKGERTRKSLRGMSNNFEEVDNAYLQYLQYTNQQIFQFIQSLKNKTDGKAAIILMSDHGYRGFERKGRKDLLYSNLNSLYLPNHDYKEWSDGMTNVNEFRALFSTLFNQEIPKKKDSLIP